jgi:hypothetical protein
MFDIEIFLNKNDSIKNLYPQHPDFIPLLLLWRLETGLSHSWIRLSRFTPILWQMLF